MNLTMAMIVFLVGGFADFWTTNKALKMGLVEANPFIRYVMDKLPYDSEVELAALKLIVFVILLLTSAPIWVWLFFGMIQLFAGVWNFTRIMKVSK